MKKIRWKFVDGGDYAAKRDGLTAFLAWRVHGKWEASIWRSRDPECEDVARRKCSSLDVAKKWAEKRMKELLRKKA